MRLFSFLFVLLTCLPIVSFPASTEQDKAYLQELAARYEEATSDRRSGGKNITSAPTYR